MAQKKTSATGISLVLIAAFLGALAITPSLLRKKSYTIPIDGSSPAETGRIDLNTTLPLVDYSKKPNVKLAQPTKLKDLFVSGRTTMLINFWATWCPPCVEELPSLDYLGRQLQASSDPSVPVLVTISVDEGLTEVGNLFKMIDFTPRFTVLFDKSGNFATQLGTVKFPETYLVNAEGKILQKWLGPQDWLSKEVLSLFKQVSRK